VQTATAWSRSGVRVSGVGAARRYAQVAASIRTQILAGSLNGPGARGPSGPWIMVTLKEYQDHVERGIETLRRELDTTAKWCRIVHRGTPPKLRTVRISLGARISARPPNACYFRGHAEHIPPAIRPITRRRPDKVECYRTQTGRAVTAPFELGRVCARRPGFVWGYSSAGRAPALQAGGQGFESP
jgi:hypothetical protein